MEKIDWAEIDGLDSDTPYSPRYRDIYFAREGAEAEYREVFHRGNDLPARWKTCSRFHSGETGFGTGIGFLETWREWLAARPPGATLHFLSFEKHPIRPADLALIHARHPALADLSAELRRKYPPRVEGIHRISLRGAVLTLVFGDALAWSGKLVLPEGGYGVEAWIFQGFAPQKNPELWSTALFKNLARLSAPGATFATFTVASEVRENLKSAGFLTERVTGYAQKKHALRGRLETPPPDDTSRTPGIAFPAGAPGGDVAVVGGGIAGLSAATALARRGFDVTLFEREPQLFAEASGNPAGITMPFLASQPDPKCLLALRSFLCLSRRRSETEGAVPPTGVVEIAETSEKMVRLIQALGAMGLPPEIAVQVSSAEIQDLSGIGDRLTHTEGGVYYPLADSFRPAELARSLIYDSPPIRIQLAAPIQSLRAEAGKWRLTGNPEYGLFSQVVIANAWDSVRLLSDCELPLTPVRGQIAILPSSDELRGLLRPVVWEKYLTPAIHGRHVLGATYSRNDLSRIFRPAENLELWASLRSRVSGLADEAPLDARIGFRAYTPDAIPAAGPAVAWSRYAELYSDLRQGFPAHYYPPPEHLSGLFVSVAHGSRGFASSMLAAELLASLLSGEILPIERELAEALHPARFALRRLRRPLE